MSLTGDGGEGQERVFEAVSRGPHVGYCICGATRVFWLENPVIDVCRDRCRIYVAVYAHSIVNDLILPIRNETWATVSLVKTRPLSRGLLSAILRALSADLVENAIFSP